MTTATAASDSVLLASPPRDRRAERALLERIADSRHFAKSALLCGFLRHICESHFAGRESELTEQQIGVRVFGRPNGYDCGADNIVRNYARQLRQRLEDYYRWEGAAERLRLEVPRGGYRPVFTEGMFAPAMVAGIPLATLMPTAPVVDSPAVLDPGAVSDCGALADASAALNPPASVQHGNAARTAARRWKQIAFAALLIAAFSLVLAIMEHRRGAGPSSQMHSFWSAVFRNDRDTVIVTADSGFGTLQDMLGRRLSLEDYMGLRLGTLAPGNRNPYVTRDMASQRYTSMTDLETAVALSHLPEVVPSRLSIRFARDLRMEDLKDNDVILLGSAYTNPWSELFDKKLNFQLEGDVTAHTWQFVNLHPMNGEARVFAGERDGASHRTYARAAWVPNLNHTGHVLLLQGIDMAGTQAAAQALLHSTALAPTWLQVEACAPPEASFEVLLGTTSIGSNAGTIEVLAVRTHCQ